MPRYFEQKPPPGFVLRSSATPEKHQIETMPGGIAALDYDNDGLTDLYVTNGASQPSLEKDNPSYYNRLFRNAGNFKFEDVTDRAGVAGAGFSIAAATADYDNDGYADIFVAGVNRNILYRNLGNGRFDDVTAMAGLSSGGRWAVSAAWFDYNRDGRLDLFVVNYVKWDPAKEPYCGEPRKFRTYCHPREYDGLPNQLFRNNGNGTFTDVSVETGISRHTGKGMGIAIADYDGDGWPDIFVANDTTPNFLFHNQRGLKFSETGFPAGVAMNDDGRALSSMGVDFRDIDNDGRPDLFITALANETFPLYRNDGSGLFTDATASSRIASITLPLSGWSTGVFDFDNDGRKDILAACGDVQTNTEVYSSRKSRQPVMLLLQKPRGVFEAAEVSPPQLHRGAAFADFDLDGRVDAALTVLDGPMLILRNAAQSPGNYIGFRLTGKGSNRDAIGATIRIRTASGEQWNHVTTAVGYASSSSKTVHFGLGKDDRVLEAEISWPDGRTQKIESLTANRYVDVAEPGRP